MGNAERRLAELRRLTEVQHQAEADEANALQAYRDARRRAIESREVVSRWLRADSEPCPLFDHLEGKEEATPEPATAATGSNTLAPGWSHGCAFPVRLDGGQTVNVAWNPGRGWLVIDGPAVGTQRRIEVIPEDRATPLPERAKQMAEHIAAQVRQQAARSTARERRAARAEASE